MAQGKGTLSRPQHPLVTVEAEPQLSGTCGAAGPPGLSAEPQPLLLRRGPTKPVDTAGVGIFRPHLLTTAPPSRLVTGPALMGLWPLDPAFDTVWV